MNTDRHAPPKPCRNEACTRPAEPGEPYCAACGLERALFRRDTRFVRPEGREDAGRKAAGR